jgi:hypothetical protein
MWWTSGFQILAFFSVTRCELKQYSVAKMSKTAFEKFVVSTLLAEHGDSVLCLPWHDITGWSVMAVCQIMLLERVSFGGGGGWYSEIVWRKD